MNRPIISYVLPTRDRPKRLAETLGGLRRFLAAPTPSPRHAPATAATGAHSDRPCGAEVIVVDNASRSPASESIRELLGPASELVPGVPVRCVRLERNAGAAARNLAVQASDPSSAWIVMLDDDSYPVGPGGDALAASLMARDPDVAAVMADIHLPRAHRREAGGLPEVFIGCGVAIRRSAFLQAGGYDAAFGYYAEEYDLAARLLIAGHRVQFDAAWRVDHQKDDRHRDMNLICERLVRNNGWVMQRYAPEAHRRDELRTIRRRYRAIAGKEHGLAGFSRGLTELRGTRRAQPRTPMARPLWDRFTGLAHARAALQTAWSNHPFSTAAIIHAGKNVQVIRAALAELGVREFDASTGNLDRADALVIGTMSPGPMLDALDAFDAPDTLHAGRPAIPARLGGSADVFNSAGTRAAAYALLGIDASNAPMAFNERRARSGQRVIAPWSPASREPHAAAA